MKRRSRNRKAKKSTLPHEYILGLLGLFFSYLSYFAEVRPRIEALGTYELGFIDCSVLGLSALFLLVSLKNLRD